MSRPLVTIGIPTFRRSEFLEEAVQSALDQTYSNVEILIRQNPSGDSDTDKAVLEWGTGMARQHEQIRFFSNSENIGAVANFNRIGFDARGKYLVFIGDDDRLLPEMVDVLVDHISHDIDVVFSNHYVIDAQGQRDEKRSTECTERYSRHLLSQGKLSRLEAKCLAWNVGIPIFASLIRTEAFQTSPFREDLLLTDTEFFIRWAQQGHRFFFVPDYLTEIRKHDERISSSLVHFDNLRRALADVSVPSAVEPYKESTMHSLTSTSVTHHLLEGRVDQARALLESEHYPPIKGMKEIYHNICLYMPNWLAVLLFKISHFLKNPFFYIYDLNRYGLNALPKKMKVTNNNL